MRGGFSFCGVDIADLGLEYAPDHKDTYVYAPGAAKIHEETFDGHHGGYTYGATKQPKTFILRCFYEETHVAKGFMAKVFGLFKIGRSGVLIFQRRPWCYYYATVTEVPDISDMHNYLNGIITITMKAYYPFARALAVKGSDGEEHLFYNHVFDPYHNEISNNTALPEYKNMIPKMTFAKITEPITAQQSVVLFNPGTERASVSLLIRGAAGDGLTIYNKATGQMCRYVAFDTEDTECIYTDGINGMTVKGSIKRINEEEFIIDPDQGQTLAFLYHDYGFLELEPAYPCIKDLYATYNGNTVQTSNMLYRDEYEKEWYIGKYIFLNEDWYKIQQCPDKHTLIVNDTLNPLGEGKIKTMVVLMNEIVITPSQGTNITKLAFIYKPTYA